MDLFRLTTSPSFSYLPEAVLSNWDSLLWIEKHKDHSSFELKTTNVADGLVQFPQMAFLGLLGSKEIMMVENQIVDINEEGIPELTVSGRSLTAFLEHRSCVIKSTEAYSIGAEVYESYISPRYWAACMLVWEYLVNSGVRDVTRLFPGTLPDDASYRPWVRRNPNTHASNIGVTYSSIPSSSIDNFSADSQLKQGQIWPQIADILSLLPMVGLRVIRPPSTNATFIDFAWPSPATVPFVTQSSTTFVANTPKLRFDVYGGIDRSINQSIVTPVVFDHDDGNLGDVRHLYSQRDYENWIMIFRDGSEWDESLTGLPTTDVFGWDLRTLFIDANEIKDEDYYSSAVMQFLIKAVDKYKMTKISDFEIVNNGPYVFGTDYDLGDVVTVRDQFNQTANMRVSEYTRSSDLNGDREFPTLIGID